MGELEPRNLSVYALRCVAQEVGHTCQQGQELEYGHLEFGARGQHEEHGKRRVEPGLQPEECQSRDSDRCRRSGWSVGEVYPPEVRTARFLGR